MNRPARLGAALFSTEDLELFAAASGDRNPLHLSEVHARRSPFGARVVYGALGALACLGALPRRPDRSLSGLVADFPGAMLVGQACRLDLVDDAPDRAVVALSDGRRRLLELTARFGPGPRAPEPEPGAAAADAPVEEAAALDEPDLVPGLARSGRWTPGGDALGALIRRFDLEALPPSVLRGLLCASYVVGMKLPGRRALFSRLALHLGGPAPAGALAWDARLARFDARFDLLEATLALRPGPEEAPFARAELRSFLRHEIRPRPLAEIGAALPPEPLLRGKVAVVVGASRGLGATLAEALALQGATVVGAYRSDAHEAEALRDRLAGAFHPVRGDGADPAFCGELAERTVREHGRLDLLVCSACPPLRPLWLEPESAARIAEHVAASVALVSAPLCACLPRLAEHGGACLIISSVAATKPVAEWPHYVAAKHAIEGLTRTAALEYPNVGFLIARPPRLLTDLTNTPLGRRAALDPARVAAALVRRLGEGPGRGVEVLEAF